MVELNFIIYKGKFKNGRESKMDNKKYKTFVVISDGECQEGSVWEAALFAAQHKLDNLVAIVDYNRVQALDKIKDVLS